MFSVAWEGAPNVILDISNDLSAWTTVSAQTAPNGAGSFAVRAITVTVSPSVTARYWRLSVMDTTAGGEVVIGPRNNA